MRLRYESKTINKDETVEFPDHAFDFAYNNMGTSLEVTYLVPVGDDAEVMKAKSSEIAAHLLGRYK